MTSQFLTPLILAIGVISGAIAQSVYIFPSEIISQRTIVDTCTTNVSGICSFTYAVPFNSTPMVAPSIQNAPSINMIARVTASSNSGYSIIVEQHNSLTILSLNVLSFAATPVSGVSVKIASMGN